MPLDFQTALDQYGFVGMLVKQTPELTSTFQRAVNEEWNSARFERELADTPWYKRFSERQRAIALQKATDPGTWRATVDSEISRINLLALQMGKTGYDALKIAELSLAGQWSDDQLRNYVAERTSFRDFHGGYTGQAGEVEAHIRETYAQYGIPVSKSTLQFQLKLVLGGTNTLGGLDQEVRTLAKKQYPAFAEQIDAGQSLREIADPYVQTMANVLEVNGDTVKLADPHIKKALQGDGKTPLTLWQFENNLKNDTRWQYTNNAKNDTYAALQQVGSDWGFL